MVNETDTQRWTALHVASSVGLTATVEILLQNGADIKAKTIHGIVPLIMASCNGHLDLVKYLISKGADVNAAAYGNETALYFAAQNGHMSVVKHLVQMGARINTGSVKIPLHAAAINGHKVIVKFLVENGTDLTCTDGNGKTATELARHFGKNDVAQYLANIVSEQN